MSAQYIVVKIYLEDALEWTFQRGESLMERIESAAIKKLPKPILDRDDCTFSVESNDVWFHGTGEIAVNVRVQYGDE